MILDVVRAVADWLADTTYGVSARLATLDYDGSDTAPTGTLTIIDETRSDFAALNRDTTTPYIRVIAQAPISLDGQAATYTHDADVPVELTIVRDGSSASAVIRDLYYTQRATLACIEQLFNPANATAAAAVLRNGVQLQCIISLTVATVRPELPDRAGTAGVLVTIRARDTLA